MKATALFVLLSAVALFGTANAELIKLTAHAANSTVPCGSMLVLFSAELSNSTCFTYEVPDMSDFSKTKTIALQPVFTSNTTTIINYFGYSTVCTVTPVKTVQLSDNGCQNWVVAESPVPFDVSINFRFSFANGIAPSLLLALAGAALSFFF
eukprot:Colp12_sorted_trinity150504_noHs@8988